MKYNSYTQKKIESIFEEIDYKIRYEKGNFQSGYCLVENTRIVVINKFFDTEARINCMLDILSKISIDESLLTPKTLEYYKKLFALRDSEVVDSP